MTGKEVQAHPSPQPLRLVPAHVDFEIEVEHVVVALRGDLTATSAEAMRTRLLAALPGGASTAVFLDLSRVTAFDLAALGVLLAARRRHVVDHRSLEVTAVSDSVAEVFVQHPDLAGLLMPMSGNLPARRAEHVRLVTSPAPSGADRSQEQGENPQWELDQLRSALATRDIIGQAKGAVRSIFSCGDDQAFAALARLSQDSNRKVVDVAGVLIDSVSTRRQLSQAWVTSLRTGIRHASPAPQ